jgi:hypothetical protein
MRQGRYRHVVYRAEMLQALAIALVALLIVSHPAAADWDYIDKDMMVRHADAIAIVTVSKIEPATKKMVPADAAPTYHQKATATAEQVIKGKLPATITIYGGINAGGSDSLCVPDVSLETGRFLVFIVDSRKDGQSWTSANADLGIRAIKNDQVEWYGKTNHDRVKVPLSKVVAEIKAQL